MRSSYAIDKICRVELPHPLLENRGSVIRNNYLEYRTNKTTHFARQNDFYALLAIHKQNIYSIGFFRAPVVTQFIVKI